MRSQSPKAAPGKDVIEHQDKNQEQTQIEQMEQVEQRWPPWTRQRLCRMPLSDPLSAAEQYHKQALAQQGHFQRMASQ